VTLLHEHGDEAKILAGGQSLMPLMNLRLAHPKVIVDINFCRIHQRWQAAWEGDSWARLGRVRGSVKERLDQEKRGWTTSLDREIRFRLGLDSFFRPPVK
jgi:hypothetical protein